MGRIFQLLTVVQRERGQRKRAYSDMSDAGDEGDGNIVTLVT